MPSPTQKHRRASRLTTDAEAARASEEKHERRASRRRARKDRDEYEDDNSEDEYAPRKPKMLEAPADGAAGGAAEADFILRERERREREREREREAAYAAPPPSSVGGGAQGRERGSEY